MPTNQEIQTQRVQSSRSSNDHCIEAGSLDLQPSQDIVDYLKTYAREKPDVAALWCFGVGFVLGWKLKPW